MWVFIVDKEHKSQSDMMSDGRAAILNLVGWEILKCFPIGLVTWFDYSGCGACYVRGG